MDGTNFNIPYRGRERYLNSLRSNDGDDSIRIRKFMKNNAGGNGFYSKNRSNKRYWTPENIKSFIKDHLDLTDNSEDKDKYRSLTSRYATGHIRDLLPRKNN